MLLAQVMEFPASLVTFFNRQGLANPDPGVLSVTDPEFEKAFIVLFIYPIDHKIIIFSEICVNFVIFWLLFEGRIRDRCFFKMGWIPYDISTLVRLTFSKDCVPPKLMKYSHSIPYARLPRVILEQGCLCS